MYARIKSMYKAIKNKTTEVALVGALTGMALLPGCRGKTPQNPSANTVPKGRLAKLIEEHGQRLGIEESYEVNSISNSRNSNLIDMRIQGESGHRFPTSATRFINMMDGNAHIVVLYSPEATRYRSENGETQKITEPALAISYRNGDMLVQLMDTAPIDGNSIDAGVILQGINPVARIRNIAERQRLWEALTDKVAAYLQSQESREEARKAQAEQAKEEHEEKAINEAWRAIKGE
ncbi:hypothetical protein KY338_05720 [Candidatus Woesearchaeota archaeon]|nr:hypothetical protein [Candidatus Woesearchaeota archaeon]MBW3006444.1 hypothetical protein [Candidatus Woesearchaeota archaeon]